MLAAAGCQALHTVGASLLAMEGSRLTGTACNPDLLPLRARSRASSLLRWIVRWPERRAIRILLPLRARSRAGSLLQWIVRWPEMRAIRIYCRCAPDRGQARSYGGSSGGRRCLRSGFAAATRQIAGKLAPTVDRQDGRRGLRSGSAAAARQIAGKLAPTVDRQVAGEACDPDLLPLRARSRASSLLRGSSG